MRLGLVLLASIKQNNLPHRYRGKHRIVKKPSMLHLLRMKMDFEREEQNMLILRHPYLTPEQSHGHKKAVCNSSALFFDKIYKEKEQKFSKQITFAERLSHLAYGEQWD